MPKSYTYPKVDVVEIGELRYDRKSQVVACATVITHFQVSSSSANRSAVRKVSEGAADLAGSRVIDDSEDSSNR